jgi:large subunit ribosomal protein L28
MNFSAQTRIMFGTDSPAYSNRYHKGLFHGKTHGQRKKRVFSMKYRIETQKPNIFRKKVKSDILDKEFKLWLSTKARKCIMKAGSLDNYLLRTDPAIIHSKFGLHLRSLIIEK